jgi:hypothetical protein
VVEKLKRKLVYLAAHVVITVLASMRGRAKSILRSGFPAVVVETRCNQHACRAAPWCYRRRYEPLQERRPREEAICSGRGSRPRLPSFFLLGCMPINRRRPGGSRAMDGNACAWCLCRQRTRSAPMWARRRKGLTHCVFVGSLGHDVNSRTAGLQRGAAYHSRVERCTGG